MTISATVAFLAILFGIVAIIWAFVKIDDAADNIKDRKDKQLEVIIDRMIAKRYPGLDSITKRKSEYIEWEMRNLFNEQYARVFDERFLDELVERLKRKQL